MSVKQLHPDWPPRVAGTPYWDQEAPVGDLVVALDPKTGAKFQTAAPISQPTERITIEDVARVDSYYVSYHDMQWSPGGDAGSELVMVLLLELTDGRWAALTAWNDYTGWGCQDGCDVRIADCREDAVAYGLTNEDRALLTLGGES